MLYFLGGLILGIFVGLILRSAFTKGCVRIDRNSMEKDIYRFEIDDIDNLHTYKRIMLKVDSNADLSQN